MFTVAIIGPDGAGKTTIARRLAQSLSLPARYVYMGMNLESSNLILPTTWLLLRVKRMLGRRPDMAGPPEPTAPPGPRGLLRGAWAALKSGLRLCILLGEECFRQTVAWFYRRRGYIVVFDRDFFADYYVHAVCTNGVKRPLGSRIHGFFLRRFYRRPDLVICLDAPGDLLLSRKGEGTVELLERRRQDYRRLSEAVRRFETVDATQPLDDVIEDVRRRILDFHHARSDEGVPGSDRGDLPSSAESSIPR